jgi:hypothetical protein
VNVAEVALAATETEGGVERAAAVSVRATVAPVADAALDRMTVQEAFEFEDMLFGVHEIEETRTGAVRVSEVFADEPLSVAVIVLV